MAGWFSLCRPRVVVTRHLMTALKAKTRRLLAPPIRVIAVSDSVVRALSESDPGRTLSVQRIHCGIDTSVFHPRPDLQAAARIALGVEPGDLVFAVVGPTQAPDGKGQFYFAAAAALVLPRYPHARFVCVGDGDAVPALRQEAKRLGLGARFTTLAFSDDVPQLLQAIDVLVHPAVNSEALGLVILEALACGKAVVASRLDGISETFVHDKHGLLVPPRDVDALAAAMCALAGDTERRLAMGAAGRDWAVEHFSLGRLGQETRRIYEASLAQGAAQSTT
jgi:glycosyltransferase involved in cell wall biosynthesis